MGKTNVINEYDERIMSQNNSNEDTIDLKELFFSLIAQWKLIALCVVISLILGFLYLRVTPDTYSVNALVQVEEKKGASAALLGDLSSMIDQKSPAQAEIEILKSRMVLGKVIDDLNLNILISSENDTLINRLTRQLEYRVEYQPSYVRFFDENKSFDLQNFSVPTQYENVNLILDIQGKNFNIIDGKTQEVVYKGVVNQETNTLTNATWNLNIRTNDQIQGRYELKKMSVAAAVDYLSKRYSVGEKGKLSGVLQLSYQGQDEYHLVKVLNHILYVYNQQNIERRSAETTQTLKVLEDQLPELKAQLDESERLYNDFRTSHNTVDIKKESELFLTQTIALETKKIELEQKRAEFSAKYTDEHPAMQDILAQEKAVNNKLAELNATLKNVPDIQRQYLQLYRDVEVNTQLYTNLLNSYQQLKVAKAGEIGSIRIIDTAVLPEKPIKPKKAIIMALSLIVGLFLGVLGALAKNLLRASGIRSSEEIENALGLPVYATVPRSPIQESRVRILKKRKLIPILAVNNGSDIAIESIKSVRTAIHFNLAQAKNSIITISGSAPELGKSFISVNLATLFAQDDKRTLVIDADLRRGYLHKYFNQQMTKGLSQYLLGSASIDEIISKTDVANLDFVQRGQAPSNPSELIGSAKFAELLKILSKKYDRIIIDTPPILAVTDAILIAEHSGINLVIARYAKTQLGELELVMNRFEQSHLKVNGFILNDIQREVGSSSYSYVYNYTSQKD